MAKRPAGTRAAVQTCPGFSFSFNFIFSSDCSFRLSSRTIFGKNFSQISAIYACKLVQLLATHRFPFLSAASSWLALLTNICAESAFAYLIFVVCSAQLLTASAVGHVCNCVLLQLWWAVNVASLWPWMADLNALLKQCSELRTISYSILFIYYWRKLQLFLLKIKRFFFRDSLELRSQIESIETLKTLLYLISIIRELIILIQ